MNVINLAQQEVVPEIEVLADVESEELELADVESEELEEEVEKQPLFASQTNAQTQNQNQGPG